MTVKELLKKEVDNYDAYEVFAWTGENHTISTDNVKYLEEFSKNAEVDIWEIMDEKRYDDTILANSSEFANFGLWHDDEEAKVLVVVIKLKN